MRIVELRHELKTLICWHKINIWEIEEILDEIQELSENNWKWKTIENIKDCLDDLKHYDLRYHKKANVLFKK